MTLLLEAIVANGLLLDAIGLIGLGVLALAALRLAAKNKSWGGSMMGYGAVAGIFRTAALRQQTVMNRIAALVFTGLAARLVWE